MKTALSPNTGVRRRLHRSVLAVISVVTALTVSLSGPAQATDISIPFDDLVFGAPGSIASIATVDVDADLVGQTCDLVVLAENQSSVHPGNDLIVSTGSSQAVVFGVEDTANGGTSETYAMLLGPSITVELRIGEDGMSSLGFGLSFDCTKPAVGAAPNITQQVVTSSSTTTTSTTTPTTTTATTATSSTTTTAAGCTTATGAAGVTVGTDCCATPAGTTTGSATTSGTDCCATAAGAAAAASGTDCCSTATAGSATSAGSSIPAGEDCCSQVIGVAVTGCAEAVTPTTTTTTPSATTTVPASVAGASTDQLAPTPAAEAVAGSPSYAG